MKKLLLVVSFNLLFIISYGQNEVSADSASTPAGNLLEMSLEDLMNVPVRAGTATSTNIRETPGIMTLITAEDIKRLGARDIVDVLQLVPGIEFGSDIQNYVGMGMRGLWGSEGKISLFIDGHEYNELGYATVPFGNHFPVDQIAKIEVIRGPGSAIYGGTSQYGVVKITTKAGEMNGVQGSVYAGKMGDNFNSHNSDFVQRSNYFVQAGRKRDDYNIYVNGYMGRAQRSTGTYTDYSTGTPVSFNGTSLMSNYSFMAAGEYKKLKTSWLYDSYSNQGVDYYGTANSPAMTTFYQTLSGYLTYEANLNDKITLKPRLYYRSQTPWSSIDSVSAYSVSDRKFTRGTARVDAVYDNKKNFNVLVGSQFYVDNGKVMKDRYVSNAPDSAYSKFLDGANNVTYHNISIYAQANYNSKIVNVTVGGRYDKHSLGFDAFVPRVALTKAFDKVHFKLLGSQSFRTPYILNYTSSDIKAEKATFFEFETGVKIGRNFFLTANVFDITVKNLLYYQNSSTGVDTSGYANANVNSGTRGFEIEGKYLYKNFSFTANYSYYNASAKQNINQYNRVDPSLVENDNNSGKGYKNYLLGFAPHKVSVIANYRIKNRLNINLNGNFFSQRFGYDHKTLDATQTQEVDVIRKFDSVFLANLFVSYDNAFVEGFSIGAGVYNLLDNKYGYITPYKAGHAAIPSSAREYVVKLSYTIGK